MHTVLYCFVHCHQIYVKLLISLFLYGYCQCRCIWNIGHSYEVVGSTRIWSHLLGPIAESDFLCALHPSYLSRRNTHFLPRPERCVHFIFTETRLAALAMCNLAAFQSHLILVYVTFVASIACGEQPRHWTMVLGKKVHRPPKPGVTRSFLVFQSQPTPFQPKWPTAFAIQPPNSGFYRSWRPSRPCSRRARSPVASATESRRF